MVSVRVYAAALMVCLKAGDLTLRSMELENEVPLDRIGMLCGLIERQSLLRRRVRSSFGWYSCKVALE